jgi:hypothetical protein
LDIKVNPHNGAKPFFLATSNQHVSFLPYQLLYQKKKKTKRAKEKKKDELNSKNLRLQVKMLMLKT